MMKYDYTEIARWAAQAEGKRVNSVARGSQPDTVLVIFVDGSYRNLNADGVEMLRNSTINYREAIDIAIRYGQIDGAHHKTWVIDQMIRVLAGSEYDDIIKQACAGEDGPNTYEWDTGIAP